MIHQQINNHIQLSEVIQKLYALTLPVQVKVSEPHSPKTRKQLKYAHSLCNALAAHHRAPPEAAKKDCKAAYGVVVVSTSLVTGERSARLTSFADYTKDQMEAFCTSMEVYLSEQSIPFIASGDMK